jgi:threonyl-tRNA synthetase
MVAITLPDGSERRYDGPTTGADVASDIGPGLAKAAMAIKVNGELRDLAREIDGDAAIEIVTKGHDDALELLRHDCAHVLAEAAKELYPGLQVTFGPAIENGFYYDFAREEPFTPEDLEKIEQRMHEIVDRDEPITREVWDRARAIDYFLSIGEKYKAEHIESLPADEEITIYRQGDWYDLCLGPHLPSTKKLGHAFKLTKLSGAYWRGDARNEQLQRVYGTCWEDDKQLRAYLNMVAEAEKRDHRRIGREMGLFHQQEEAVGSVFWHPKGWTLYRVVERYMRARLEAAGYVEVKTPQLIDRALWEASGHWEKFHEHMFIAESEERMLAVKPMNCPAHVQIFKQGIKSYRDLPLRMGEFGSCHRNEPSGALHGLMRVRAFTQDDAHIFCTPEQINSETIIFCELLKSIYADLGFPEVTVKLADRPPVRTGSDETWDKAEKALVDAIEATGLHYELNPGEGAFYGPKLEFVLTDAIGREWQCGTHQVDFVMPERLDASYVGEDGQKHRPVMLHRAILGSFERFLAIMIEQYAGRFPLWLAPVQVVVATITSDADDYALQTERRLLQAGLRAEIAIIAVVGRREADDGTVALRRLGSKEQEFLALDDAIARIKQQAAPPDGS